RVIFESFDIEFVRCIHERNIRVQRMSRTSLEHVFRYESVCAFQTIDKRTHPQNHPLVDEFFKRLVLSDESAVVEKFIPEAAVQKVAGSVLASADVEVDVLPIFL